MVPAAFQHGTSTLTSGAGPIITVGSPPRRSSPAEHSGAMPPLERARRRYHRAVPDHAADPSGSETAGDDLTRRPPLDGATEADVAILGAA
jgi:hypothetical protein